MRAQEKGVLSSSNLYFHTASPRAKKLFFYPLCTGHFICDGDYDLRRTSYDSFLVMHIVHGTGFLEVDNQVISLKEGDFVLVDCYQPHHYYTETGWELLWLHFDGPMARSFFEELTGKSLILPPTDIPAAYKALKAVYDVYNLHRDQSEPALSCMISNFLCMFFNGPTTERSEDPSRTPARSLGDTLSYISENLDSPLTVDELAERIFLSKYYFIRLFKKEVGYTPHEYIVVSRVNFAAFLLKSTAFSIKNIAIKCGFADESSFCTTFKRVMGSTPLSYRNSGK
ncbi:AraC family transcriptional regulator [Clostridium sp. Marseille-P3244]|uniref:AraC family transcriptional regulator n=1 Tax=Clostridium sp. Marseille-P3244 TaxID=1871020 RepID=UPI000930349C|nr:AraC family transcriptional regulator [Clostridium sp. Marseille-P3244]